MRQAAPEYDKERFEAELAELERRERHARKLPGMGYWEQEHYFGPGERNPEAKTEVLSQVAPMTEDEVEALVTYMDAGSGGARWRGWASCRVCDRKERLGTMCMVTPDKKWRFPEKWQHYITAHSVRPPEEFITDALAWRAANHS